MKLIIGLGNPGPEYEKTRHNAGFRAVRLFHTMHAVDFDGWKDKFQALVSEGRVGGEKIVLMMPQTFMNESGRAVREAADFWKVGATDLLVVSDDITLPLGTLRARRDGSAGGHNGLKSIFEMMATENIPRLRIGVGNETLEMVPAEKFVLERFGANEEDAVGDALRRAAEALDIALTEGLDAAMNKVN